MWHLLTGLTDGRRLRVCQLATCQRILEQVASIGDARVQWRISGRIQGLSDAGSFKNREASMTVRLFPDFLHYGHAGVPVRATVR